MSEPPAILKWDGKEIELPIVRGTEDEVAIDISKLRAQTGLITLDYGFVNTGATESAITFIDGDLGSSATAATTSMTSPSARTRRSSRPRTC